MRRSVVVLVLLVATTTLSACEDEALDAFLELYDLVDLMESDDPELQMTDQVMTAADDWRRSHIELEERKRDFNRIMSDPTKSFYERTLEAEAALGGDLSDLDGNPIYEVEDPIYEHSRMAVLYAFGDDVPRRDRATEKLIAAETAAQAGGRDPVDPDCVNDNVTRHLYEAQAETLNSLHPGWENSPPGPGDAPEVWSLYKFHLNADYPARCDG